MKSLPADWISRHPIDAEHKRYLLLAYLQRVHADFQRRSVYPGLSELIFHYRNLRDLIEKKELMITRFPKALKGVDPEKLRLVYEHILVHDDLFDALTEIIEESVPLLQRSIRAGTELHEELEEQIALEPVGLHPLYRDEGYFFLQMEKCADLFIYRYRLTSLSTGPDPHRGLETSFLSQAACSLSHTVNHWKAELIRTYKEWPNPAVFLFTSRAMIPLRASFLPIAKRMLLRNLLSV